MLAVALAVIGISLIILGLLAIFAPLGYQDKRGFHYGEPPQVQPDGLIGGGKPEQRQTVIGGGGR